MALNNDSLSFRESSTNQVAISNMCILLVLCRLNIFYKFLKKIIVLLNIIYCINYTHDEAKIIIDQLEKEL